MSVRKGNKIIAGSYAVVKPEVYTKVETDDLLNQKQDKLIAGNNIFIDENNVISSSGGSGSFINVVQETGDSTEDVMSQASVTYELEQKANTIDLADVSLSGDYEDLSNTPDLSVYTKTEDLAEIAFTADYEDLGNTPDLTLYAKNEELSKVATTNNYNDLDNKPNLELYDTTISVNNKLSLKQDLLTAGEGISIEGNTISSTVNSAEWGNIIGDITNQADLQERLNGKLGIDFDNITEEGVKKLVNIIGTGDYMFDTRLVDHELTYEQSKGWALQGTYVYKEAVAGSRYGYPDFYNKCVEEFENSDNSTTWLKNNVTQTGGTFTDKYIYTGASGAYLTVDGGVLPLSTADSWEFVTKYTYNGGGSSNVIFGGVEDIKIPKLQAMSNVLSLYVSSNGTSWDLISKKQGITLTTGTTYYIKLGFTGSEYYVDYKVDGTEEYTRTISVASTTKAHCSVNMALLNQVSHSDTYYSNGSMDLSETYVTINGERWWSGISTVIKNPNGHLFYDISEKSKVDEVYINNGIAWYYGIDKENERVFLPRTKWFIQPTGEITEVNTVNEAGLPNITGTVGSWQLGGDNCSGAFDYASYGSVSYGGSSSTEQKKGATFDASRCSAIYSNSDTVQPQSINQLLYICVGNTVADTSFVDVVTQVENGVKDIDDAVNDGVSRLNSIDSLKTTQITNCLLEVPQRIKLELNDGVLTLKAGSQVIVPNGFEEDGVTPRFDCMDIESDITYILNYLTTDKIVLMWDLKYSVLGTERFSIMSSGTTPSNYDQYGTWYDTNANIVKYTNDSGATWISSRSLPIAILDTDGASTITSINQTFNGFGYIGSTVWVDKGVKGLIPNGRNEDGTLNNIEYTTSKVAIRDVGLIDTDCTYVIVSSNEIVDFRKLVVSETQPTTTYTLWYKPSENILYTTRGDGEPVMVVDGFVSLDCYRTNTTISNFNPKQPFRAVDWSDGIRITETYVNGASWYRVYSDGWCEQGGIGTVVSGGTTTTLLKPYKDTNYTITVAGYNSATYCWIGNKTTSTIMLTGSSAGVQVLWQASGYIA